MNKSIAVVFFFFGLTLFMPNRAFSEAPLEVSGAQSLSVEDAKKLYDLGIKFIDVRRPYRHAAGHIKGAVHMNFSNEFNEGSLLALLGSKDTPFVPYCDGVNCGLSALAVQRAMSWGFKQVYYYRGGLPEWRNRGYPVEGETVKK